MKLILLSDLHLVGKNPSCRKDDLFERQFEKLQFIFDYAVKNNATILQAGDFFDKPSSIKLLTYVFELIYWYSKLKIGKKIRELFCVFGQHDMKYRNKEDTCLGFMRDLGYCYILGTAIFENEVIYGCSWGEKVPIVKDKKSYNILVIHHPVSNYEIIGMKTQNHKEFLKKHKDYDLILCGDIHKKFFYRDKDNRIICNTGPMNRKTIDLKNHSPGFWLFDTDTKKEKWIEIPYEKDVFIENKIEEKLGNQKIIKDFVDKIRNMRVKGVDIKNKLLITMQNEDIDDFTREVLLKLIGEEKG